MPSSFGRGLLIGSFGDRPRAKGDLRGDIPRSTNRVVVAGVLGAFFCFFGDFSWLLWLSGAGLVDGEGRFAGIDFP